MRLIVSDSLRGSAGGSTRLRRNASAESLALQQQARWNPMGRWRACIQPGGCIYRIYQVLTYLPVFIVIAAVSWGYYAYIVQLCFLTVDNLLQRTLYILFFHIFMLLFLFSYYQTIVTRPKKPPHQFYLDNEAEMELAACEDDDFRRRDAVLRKFITRKDLPIRTKGYDGIRYCDKCKMIKPDRAHHCSICGLCVLKFDHHCPWVNNCVNYHNYKFFLLFLGYGALFCLFVLFTDLPFFIDFWRFDFKSGMEFNKGKFQLMFLIFVSMLFAISLLCLFIYHLWLTSKNRTTVESFRAVMLETGPDRNAFNHGIRANYREVFGTNPWFWFLPVFSSEGDGSEFKTRRDAPLTYRQSTSSPGQCSYRQTDETSELSNGVHTSEYEMRHINGNAVRSLDASEMA
ncbi:hypothetical protein WR25_25625 [Diploscapter pachys]|uniref:Palmitoyltransferase n=1 Tax=Diploscapter pachys TaxID=2018661 RepID=A0A2A2LLB7_9BILA|nr:hypothetical protein WR25_25625 [Diploscapter pachys]